MTVQEADAMAAEVMTTIGAIQNFHEMREFALFCSEHEIADFVELGTLVGGMFLLMDRACKPGLRVSIDLPWPQRDPKVIPTAEATFADLFPNAIQIYGNTHEWETRVQLVDLLQKRGKLCDLIYQDSSHDYEGSMQDFEQYKEYVRPGGYFAFHDVRCGHGTKFTFDELCKTHMNWVIADHVSPFGTGILQL